MSQRFNWLVITPPYITCTYADFVLEINYAVVGILTLVAPNYLILIFTHVKLCLATATHKFTWVNNTHYLFNFRSIIRKSWSLNTNLILNNCHLNKLIKQSKTTMVVTSVERVNVQSPADGLIYFANQGYHLRRKETVNVGINNISQCKMLL